MMILFKQLLMYQKIVKNNINYGMINNLMNY